MVVGDLCEVVDDLIDGDKEVTKADIIRTLYTALVDLPSNPFFKSYSEYLVPVIETGINAWLDANELEKSHDKRDRMFAYVLRDQYMDVLFMCLTITRGRAKMREISLEVREFFTQQRDLRGLSIQNGGCDMSAGGGSSKAAKPSSEERENWKQQTDIARGLWDSYQSLGAPVLEQLSGEALEPLDKDYDALASSRASAAGTDVEQAFGDSASRIKRQLERAGVRPDSGRFTATMRSWTWGVPPRRRAP